MTEMRGPRGQPGRLEPTGKSGGWPPGEPVGKRQGKGDKLTDGQAAGPRGQSGRLEPTGKSGGCLRGKSGGNVKRELRLPSEEMS